MADWTTNGAELFLNSSDSKSILAMYYNKIAFFIPNTSDCKRDKEEFPIKVNDKYVTSYKYCKNGGVVFFINFFYDGLFVMEEAFDYKNIEVIGLQSSTNFFENKGLIKALEEIPPYTGIEIDPSGKEIIYKRSDNNQSNNLFFNNSDVVISPR